MATTKRATKPATKPAGKPAEPAAKPTTAAAPAPDPLPAIVDEIGDLAKELAPYAGKIARLDQLRKALRAQTPDTTHEITGERFVALCGPRGNETVIDFPALVERIGAVAFSKFARATLKDLHAHVKPGILAFFLSQKQTGPRSITVLERGAPAK